MQDGQKGTDDDESVSSAMLSWSMVHEQLGPTEAVADPNHRAGHLISEVIYHGQEIS